MSKVRDTRKFKIMARNQYEATFTYHNDGEIVVTFKDFPEIVTSGNSTTDAINEAMDAVSEAIAGRCNRNK